MTTFFLKVKPFFSKKNWKNTKNLSRKLTRISFSEA